jgi:transposase InsO family protein
MRVARFNSAGRRRNRASFSTVCRSVEESEAVEFATLEWVDWFNNRRLLEPFGYVPPAEFEAACYDKQMDPDVAIGFN